jgi:head-tail adaptor
LEPRVIADLGPMDRRIRIEQRSTSQDSDYGTQVDTWTTFGTFWATVQEVLPSKGETQTDGARIAERPARVRMRYVSGITSDMRAVFLDRSSRIMKIMAQPVEIGRKVGIEFMAADYTTSGAGS